MYATYSMSSICSMYSMQHAAASSRDRIREDYAQQQQTFQARHRHRLPRQLRRFAREFMELTECSSGSSGREWEARRSLPFASCSCRHELDLPFSQGLVLAAGGGGCSFQLSRQNIKISATKDHLSRILQQLQHSQLQLLNSPTFWYL